MNRAAEIGPTAVPWWQDWRGECAAIVASGPSAKHAPVDMLRDRIHVIAINTSVRLVPWCEIIYACDHTWWKLHNGLPEFKGLKLSHDRSACNEYQLKHIEIPDTNSNAILTDKPSFVGSGGNGAFQALNLAIQFGATGIMLVGVDCHLDNGAHWHGRHPTPLRNPEPSNVRRWITAFDGSAKMIKALGVDVVNCSLTSHLKNYPKVMIPEALARWQL